jgi:hypothetical protein
LRVEAAVSSSLNSGIEPDSQRSAARAADGSRSAATMDARTAEEPFMEHLLGGAGRTF